MDPRKILDEASKILGERGQDYGGIEENFARIASIAQLVLNIQVTPYQVAMIHVATKLARMAGSRDKQDNYVDAINYIAFANDFRAPAK